MATNSEASNDEGALTRTSEAGLRRLGKNLETTEKILARSEDRYVQFFREHTDFFLRIVSKLHPLDPALIDEYSDQWYWEGRGLSGNESLDWTEELISRHKDRWNWGVLSANESLPWTTELIDRYVEEWDWRRLSRNEALPLDERLLEQFRDRWQWSSISANEEISWSADVVDSYMEELNQYRLGQNEGLPGTRDFFNRIAAHPRGLCPDNCVTDPAG
jgi:hypothetical protein